MVAALGEDVREGFVVGGDFIDFEGGFGEDGREFRGDVGGVNVVFSGAFVFYEEGGFELGELCGDAALAHAEDLLELCDGQWILEEEGEDAQACGVRDEF